MKRNVDLTENRMFSINEEINILRFYNEIRNKYPWLGSNIVEVHDDDELRDLGKQRDRIITTGNKATRAKIKEFRQMDSENYCDCCGIRMNLKPWDGEFGVCHRCDDYLENQEIDKCKWRVKEIIRNAI